MSQPPETSSTAPDQVTEAQLRDSLRRCSEQTIQAALAYRQTKAPAHTLPVVVGIIERYVDPELRAKLTEAGEDLRLVEDLGLDSLTMMEIVMLVEEVVGLTISNDELRGLLTVGDIRTFIDRKAAGLDASPASPVGDHPAAAAQA
ncbi:MAG: acyl carrier protein [Verrucomicrobia bacterium]|nr:acyl carrier protein [Verrucomicrobiota bacterium]